MPRPQKRCRGGRTTPKGTRPSDMGARALPTAEEILMRDAGENFRSCTDLDGVETMASGMLTMIRPQDGAPESVLDAPRALAAARRCPDATAAAGVAAALGAHGPPGQRHRARSLLAKLAADGAAVPGWAGMLGDVVPRRALLLADAWDDDRALWIDYARGDGEVRGIGMQVNAWEGGLARSFLYGPATEDVAAAEAVPHSSVSEISLADARAVALEGLEWRDVSRPPADDEVDDEDLDDENMRALIDQRVGLLPEGGASPFAEPPDLDDIDDLFDAFLDEHFAAAPETVRDGAGWVVENACRFADACCDMDPLRWSPLRVAMHLVARIPAEVVCDDESLAAVESVFPRWLRFVGERRGLDEDLLEMNVAKARESFSEMRANAADPSKRSSVTNILTGMIADGVDFGEDAAVQAWIDAYTARPVLAHN